MNQTHNINNQMLKGFKTFVLTLSISLIIFSVAYFMVSDNSYGDYDYLEGSNESNQMVVESEVLGKSTQVIQIQTDPILQESENIQINQEDILLELNDKNSDTTFGKIVNTPIETNSRAVLAEGDSAPTANSSSSNTSTSPNTQTRVTTAPVPESGVTEMTWGFALSLVAFALGLFVISKDPRKLAIKSFEKEMMR